MKGILVLLLAIALSVDCAENQCPPEQETNWEIEQLLRHEDCDKFYKCTFGKPITYQCPDELYFNLDTWQCDWPENVDCTDRNDPADFTTTLEPTTPEPTTTTPVPTTTTTTTTTTTPAPTTTTTTPAPTTTTTTPEPTTTTTTTTTPAPTTTTTTTTTPAPTTTTTTTTPAPTTTTTTTTPAPTTTTTTTTPAPTTTTTTTTPAPTTTTTTTTPAPTTTSSTTTTTTPLPECEVNPEPEPEPEPESEPEQEIEIDFLENGCPVDPHVHWLLPHEEDCNLFYYCVWGEKVLRQCPSTLHFNPVIQVCDWPDNAGCAVSANKHLESRLLLKQILL